MVSVQTLVPSKEIASFCKRWKVVEFALFGSALRGDFSQQSDIDALVSFAPKSQWSLFDHIRMEQELQELFGRDVDLVTRRRWNKAVTPCCARKSWARLKCSIQNTHAPMSKRRDDIVMEDILNAAQLVSAFVEGFEKAAFMDDWKTRSAVL